jgi:hypothetical protein
MNRTLPALVFVFGAAIGAAVTLYLKPVTRGVAPTPSSTQPAQARDRGPNLPAAPAAAATTSTRQRSSLYSRAAEADAARLDELLADLAAQPPSPPRAFATGVYLRRYVELDPPRALATARAAGIATADLADLYGAWAAADAESALDALRTLGDSAETRALAVGILAALGNDEAALAKVTAAIAPEQATRLRLASVELRAEASPDAALDAALALPDPLRGSALERVAELWTRSDVRTALARADEIADERMRQGFRFAVLTAWIRFDADAMLVYLAQVDDETRQQFLMARGVQEIARADPRRALETARLFPDEIRPMVEQIALQKLSMDDPLAALEYADKAATPGRKRQMLQSIAVGYGRKDPDAALAWARANESDSARRGPYGSLVQQVITGIAMQDPNRAFDLTLTLGTGPERAQAVRMFVMNSVSMRATNAKDLAQHVLTIEDAGLRTTAIDAVVESWSSRAPREALDWFFANGGDAPLGSLENVAQQLGRNDPSLAASYTARVPSAARELWVRGVALGYSQTDPAAALRWVEQFRGEPAYEAGVAMIAPSLAGTDPQRAADLLSSLPSAAQYDGALLAVAGTWAGTEPARAADWTLSLKPGRVRDQAVTQVTQRWAAQDLPNARNWALRVPTGATRDASLAEIVGAVGAVSTVDLGLWAAFSDDRARERAAVRAMISIAARDPDEARALLERYVNDPDARRQAEQMIEAGRNGARLGRTNMPRGVAIMRSSN